MPKNKLRNWLFKGCGVVSVMVVLTIVLDYMRGTTLATGLKDLGEARELALFEYAANKWNHVIAVLSLALVPTLSTAFCYWSHIGKKLRRWVIVLTTLFALTSVGGGNRSGMYAVAMYLFLGLGSARVAGRIRLRLSLVLAVSLIGLGAFVAYSNWVIYDRYKLDRGRDYAVWLTEVEEFRTQVNLDSPILTVVPRAVAPTVIQGVFYFGHAYNSLAYSLLKPDEGFGFGVGHSQFLTRTAVKLFGDSAYKLAKPYRLQIEEGASSSWWYTSYMWVASDATYLGSIFVFGFFAYVLGASWKATLLTVDPLSASAYVWVGASFFLAHNIFITAEYSSWIGFWGSIILFLAFRINRTVCQALCPRAPSL